MLAVYQVYRQLLLDDGEAHRLALYSPQVYLLLLRRLILPNLISKVAVLVFLLENLDDMSNAHLALNEAAVLALVVKTGGWTEVITLLKDILALH